MDIIKYLQVFSIFFSSYIFTKWIPIIVTIMHAINPKLMIINGDIILDKLIVFRIIPFLSIPIIELEDITRAAHIA
jgi:hypothetical protein